MDADRLATRLNPLVAWILRSPFHPLLSRFLMLITVTGRRSGRRYTLPVGYQRRGDTLTILVSKARRKGWWRNFREAGPIQVNLRGRLLAGEARVVPGGSPRFREAIQETLRRIPSMGPQLGVSGHAAAPPSEAQWRAIADQAVVVEITVAPVEGATGSRPLPPAPEGRREP